jgi:hypothetical protein
MATEGSGFDSRWCNWKFSLTRSFRQEDLNCPNLSIEQVHDYKYLRSIINDNNSTEEEIKEKIVLGKKAYYAKPEVLQK